MSVFTRISLYNVISCISESRSSLASVLKSRGTYHIFNCNLSLFNDVFETAPANYWHIVSSKSTWRPLVRTISHGLHIDTLMVEVRPLYQTECERHVPGKGDHAPHLYICLFPRSLFLPSPLLRSFSPPSRSRYLLPSTFCTDIPPSRDERIIINHPGSILKKSDPDQMPHWARAVHEAVALPVFTKAIIPWKKRQRPVAEWSSVCNIGLEKERREKSVCRHRVGMDGWESRPVCAAPGGDGRLGESSSLAPGRDECVFS